MEKNEPRSRCNFLLILCFVSFFIGSIFTPVFRDYFFTKNYIESKSLIIPELKMITDGKKIDTVYIYTKKDN